VVSHWYGPGQGRPEASPGLLVRLAVEHADGGRTVVATDGSWRVARGAVLPAPYRNGDGRDYVERIDGRAEPPGWDRPGFDDAGWLAPDVLGNAPDRDLHAPPGPGRWAWRTRRSRRSA